MQILNWYYLFGSHQKKKEALKKGIFSSDCLKLYIVKLIVRYVSILLAKSLGLFLEGGVRKRS